MRGSNSFHVLQRLALGFSLLFISEAAPTGAAERNVPSALRSQIDSAIALVKPALVRIRVVSTDYSEGREVKMQAVGSGAIITRDGYLITNHHVAGHAGCRDAIETEWQINVVPDACAQGTFGIVCPDGGGHEGVVYGTAVSRGYRNKAIALGFYGGVEVIVGDLRYDHVSFGIPGQYRLREAQPGAQAGQEFRYLHHGY